jgi:N-formylglutamate amidohydrolase
MNAVRGAQGEGGAGRARADFVVGDRDGTTCDAEFTELVRGTLAAMGYDVRVNDPYKGVELVRAYSNPAEGRMSLQLEINKRLYMDEATRRPHKGFATVQQHLLQLVEGVIDYSRRAARRHAGS